MTSFNWPDSNEFETILVLGGSTFAFCLTHYLFHPNVIEQRLKDPIKAYYISKVLSGFLMSFVALGVLYYTGFDLHIFTPTVADFIFGSVFALTLFVMLFPLFVVSAKDPNMQSHYPELRVSKRNRALVVQSAIVWFVYLMGYEFLIRGAVLYYGVERWGFWNGMTVMTVV